jgi:hypothetical protein
MLDLIGGVLLSGWPATAQSWLPGQPHDRMTPQPLARSPEPATIRREKTGTAFFVDDTGYMLTARHVLAQGIDYRDPAKAPPSWGQFAKLVQYRFETWIGADEEIANRFRAYVIDHAGKEDGPPPTLVVRAWLNPDGTVERVTFDALKDARANTDLRTILTRGNIGEAPPPQMLQPLNLRFSLNLKK